MNVVDGLMHQISAHSESFGAVHNPYDPSRIPGGSSGGNGAILAARIVPAALGLDTNGSIRCPSAFCGVTGLRPSTYTMENAINRTSRKRYSDDGLVLPPARRLDTIGPMARTVVGRRIPRHAHHRRGRARGESPRDSYRDSSSGLLGAG
jgi:Asp-tRNA(Asn)/Glu-tRNA(Gln) amidotransferase A subunit family amidase